jgi:hypothetical protein
MAKTSADADMFFRNSVHRQFVSLYSRAQTIGVNPKPIKILMPDTFELRLRKVSRAGMSTVTGTRQRLRAMTDTQDASWLRVFVMGMMYANASANAKIPRS